MGDLPHTTKLLGTVKVRGQCTTQAKSSLTPARFNSLQYTFEFDSVIMSAFTYFTGCVLPQRVCPPQIYWTNSFLNCNMLDIRQFFTTDMLKCIQDFVAIPIYSLQLLNLCYVREKSLSLDKPYLDQACHLIANGIV